MQDYHKYNSITRFLHWVSAAVILWAMITGIYVAPLDDGHAEKEIIGFINVSLTTVFIPIFLWRLLNRVYYINLSTNSDEYYKSTLLARSVHNLMYVLICIVLISGVLMMNNSINVFDELLIPRIIHDQILNNYFEHVHIFFNKILAVVVLIHLVAVIKHELAGVHVLRKML